MKNQKQEENEEYFCKQHKKPILMVQVDAKENTPFQDRFVCSECFKNKKHGPISIIGFDEVKNIIKEQLQTVKQEYDANKDLFLQSLNKFLKIMKQRKQEVAEKFETIIMTLQIWIQQTKEGMLYPNDELTYQILNTPYLREIEESLQSINYQKDLSKFYNSLNKLSKAKKVLKNVQDNDANIFRIELQTSKTQQNVSTAQAFDKTGTILAAGSNENIIIFQIEQSKLIRQKTLIGHTALVTCIMFSQKDSWFLSGAEDNTIISWIQQQDNHWKGQLLDTKHTKRINCLIMNKTEDQLISCGLDRAINVWQANGKVNKLYHCQTLEEKHTGEIHSITLNQSESALVSSGENRQLILWMKKDLKWVFINQIQTEGQAFRISFINDTQIIVPRNQNSQVDIYENQNRQLMRVQDKCFRLSKPTDGNNDLNLFPIRVLKQKKLIILKHHQYVHILIILDNGKFQPCTSLYCSSSENYGAISENGEHLLIWAGKKQRYRVYQIKYE